MTRTNLDGDGVGRLCTLTPSLTDESKRIFSFPFRIRKKKKQRLFYLGLRKQQQHFLQEKTRRSCTNVEHAFTILDNTQLHGWDRISFDGTVS